MKISAQLVKELRIKSGAGILDCKKALEANEGKIDSSIKWLREKGIAKAQRKNNRIAAEGMVHIFKKDNRIIILEVNSETDFVAKNKKFLIFVDQITELLILHNPISVESALKLIINKSNLSDYIAHFSATIGEKITLRRFSIIYLKDNQSVGFYTHNAKSGAILVFDGKIADKYAKQLSMHVTAMNPKFIARENVPSEFIASEEAILMKKALLEGKPKNIVEKIVKGRLNKLLSENCFLDQKFIVEPTIKVSDFIKKQNCILVNMLRYEVGEGIIKENNDFATEVMKQIKK